MRLVVPCPSENGRSCEGETGKFSEIMGQTCAALVLFCLAFWLCILYFFSTRVTQKSKFFHQAIGCKTLRLVPLRVTSPQIRSCKGSETRSTGLSETDAEFISEHQDEKASNFLGRIFRRTGETFFSFNWRAWIFWINFISFFFSGRCHFLERILTFFEAYTRGGLPPV